MSIYSYTLEGHSISDTDAGLELVVRYIVTEDELDSTATPHTRLHSALGVSGIPVRGSAHPTITGIQVVRRSARPFGDTTVEVDVIYAEPTETSDSALLDTTGVVSFSSAVQTETTNRDKDGNLMNLSWSGVVSDVYADSFDGTPMTDSSLVTAQVSKPRWGVKIVKRVASLATLEGHLNTHLTTVNSDVWSGYPARTFLCTDISAEGQNTTDLRATYSFLYNPETWDLNAVFRFKGITIPKNIDTPTGNGLATYQLYESSTFASMGVSF